MATLSDADDLEFDTTDWISLDSAFQKLREQFSYCDVSSDHRAACDTFRSNEDRIDPLLSREWHSISLEMSAFVYRCYIERGVFKPLIRDANTEMWSWVAAKLRWLRVALADAGEIGLLKRLLEAQLHRNMSWVISNWRVNDRYFRGSPNDFQPSEVEYGPKLSALLIDWFDPMIEFFSDLNDAEAVDRLRTKRDAFESRSFLEPVTLSKPEKRKIDDDTFWAILSESAGTVEGDVSLRYEALSSSLEKLAAPSIRNFARRYDRVLRSFAHHDLTAFLVFAYGTGSADFFFDFCEEIIWRGDRELAESLVTNPLAVADKLPKLEEVTDETPVSDAIDAASIARSGESIDWPESAMKWKGRMWTPKNLNDRYPELAKLFGKAGE